METFRTMLLMLGLTILPATNADQKVKLTLFYESYCPYSKAYISSQLRPAYNRLSNIMYIEFNPTSIYVTKCQHGPQECVANKYQACALRLATSQNIVATYRYIFCMEEQNQPANAGQSCANSWKLDFNRLQQCYNSDEGLNYIKNYLANKNRQASSGPAGLPYFPWILLNGQTNNQLQSLIRENTYQAVCQEYFRVNKRKGQGC